MTIPLPNSAFERGAPKAARTPRRERLVFSQRRQMRIESVCGMLLLVLLCSCATQIKTAGDPDRYVTYPNGCTFFDGFADNGDGTVTDPRNGLIWQKCAWGFTWDGENCVGGMDYKKWGRNWWGAMEAAKSNRFLGKNDWRLPTEEEFRSIVGDRALCQVPDSGPDQHKSYGPAVSAKLAHAVSIYSDGPYPGTFWAIDSCKANELDQSYADSNAVAINFKAGMYYPPYDGLGGPMRFNDNIGVRLVRSDNIRGEKGYALFDQEYQLRIVQGHKRYRMHINGKLTGGE